MAYYKKESDEALCMKLSLILPQLIGFHAFLAISYSNICACRTGNSRLSYNRINPSLAWIYIERMKPKF